MPYIQNVVNSGTQIYYARRYKREQPLKTAAVKRIINLLNSKFPEKKLFTLETVKG